MRLLRATTVPLIAVIALAVAVALAGCAQKPPSTPPGITGTVTSFVPGDERPDSILVEAPATATGAGPDKAQVQMTTATQFFDARGKPAKAALIGTGTKVRVWFAGPVAESYPVQGTAAAVQVLGN